MILLALLCASVVNDFPRFRITREGKEN